MITMGHHTDDPDRENVLLVEQFLTNKMKIIQRKEIVTKVQRPVSMNTINNKT